MPPDDVRTHGQMTDKRSRGPTIFSMIRPLTCGETRSPERI
jgi:hypothetical protein